MQVGDVIQVLDKQRKQVEGESQKSEWRFTLKTTNAKFMPWLNTLSLEKWIEPTKGQKRRIHGIKHHTYMPAIFWRVGENPTPYPYPSHIKLSFIHTLDNFNNENSRPYLDVETTELGDERLKVVITTYQQDDFEREQVDRVLGELMNDYASDIHGQNVPAVISDGQANELKDQSKNRGGRAKFGRMSNTRPPA